MMRVLLINPSRYDGKGMVEKYRLGTLPPLNLVEIASLISAPDVEVRIVDEYLESIPFDEPWDLVGITTIFTCTFPRVKDISGFFRKKGIPVVLGGTHATCAAQETIRYADSIVLGEAEGRVDELLDDLRCGRGLKQFYGGTGFVDLERQPYREPRYDLLDLSRYLRLGVRRKTNLFMIESSRGCPMSCTFCSIGVTHGKRLRCRSIPAVIEEIRFLKQRYGARFFAFADDNFSLDADRCRELCRALAREEIRFYCELSTTVVKQDGLIEELARAGCVSALLGMESIDEQNLASVRKGFNKPSEYRELFSRFRRHRISAMAAMIFGFDHDDREVFLRTVSFLKQCNVPRALLTLLTPVPGTVLYEQLKQSDRIWDENLSHYDGAHAVFKPARMSPHELEEGLWTAYRTFYDLPSIILRTIKAGRRAALYTLVSNWRFRELVYQRLYPYNSGVDRIS